MLLAATALGAARTDPRVEKLRAWTNVGYVLEITEKDETAIVDVSPKWVRLPLARQTAMAATIAGLVHDRQELDQVTIEKLVDDPSDPDHDPLLLGRCTDGVCSWEGWYALEVQRREFARSK